MDNSKVAKEIIEFVGGKENIKFVEHCATRLRFILHDKDKVDGKSIENIEGVKGQFFSTAQYQIILGTGVVNKVYDEVMSEMGGAISNSREAKSEAVYSELSLIQKISRTFGDVFVPIIPVLVATGIFMGLRGLLTNLGVITEGGNLYALSQVLTDTAFSFLPALVAWSTMKKFGGSPVIGIVIGLMLVSPILPNAYNVGSGAESPFYLSVLGINIPIIGYQGSVLPALVLGIIASKIQKGLKKIIPDIIDLIVTPFLTLLVSMVLGLLVIGPIMHAAELFVFDLIKNFMLIPFGVGSAIVAGVHQVIVITGVHHAFNALEIELISSTGLNPFNAMISCGIVAQGAAALGVALRTKDKKKRSLYISSAVPAFLGITEPAIFGVNLRFLRPFIFGCIGGFIGGIFVGIFNLAGTGLGITAIPGVLLYLNNIPLYLLVNLISFASSFCLTYFLFKPVE